MTLDPDPLDATDHETWTDAAKLRLLALWFDKWDRTDYADRQRMLDDGPGRHEVQADLRRIARRLAEPPYNPPDNTKPRSGYVLVYLLLAVIAACVVAGVWMWATR